MKRMTVLLALLAPIGGILAAPPPLNSAATNRVLIIDRSSTAVSGGKATLSIEPLKRTAEVYSGDTR